MRRKYQEIDQILQLNLKCALIFILGRHHLLHPKNPSSTRSMWLLSWSSNKNKGNMKRISFENKQVLQWHPFFRSFHYWRWPRLRLLPLALPLLQRVMLLTRVRRMGLS